MKNDNYEAIAWGATLFSIVTWMLFAWPTSDAIFWGGLAMIVALGWVISYLLEQMGED